MGVSGSGTSTVGAALAQRIRVPFADADDFHPPANIAKMTAGEPLNDDDRHPWLDAIGEWLGARCPDVIFLHLAGSATVATITASSLMLGLVGGG
jgi:gluconokinase